MQEAYILASFRTPGCKAKKGKFKDTRPDDLAAVAIKETIIRAGIDSAEIDDIYMGCAFPEGEQGMNPARIAALKAGVPIHVPAATINRFCSSGLQTIAFAADRIRTGQAHCIIAGGMESMTMIPMGGNKYSANPGLMHDYPESFASMGITAELLVDKFGITREEQDEFALNSHLKAAAAIKNGTFKEEIIPVEIENVRLVNGKLEKKLETVDIDDGVRPDTSLDGLAKLRPAFREGGTVTAGNSSQMTDGAAATIVVSGEFLKKHGMKPMAKFLGFAVKGVEPELMGIGPVQAIPAALKMTGLTMNDMGLIELNEAFAAQSLAVIKELNLDLKKLNVNGGAIALGHPLGCTGAKLTATLLHEMKRRNEKYGMVTMCIGGGMGAAGIFELVEA